jgi:hypothetical protein
MTLTNNISIRNTICRILLNLPKIFLKLTTLVGLPLI